MTGERIKPTDRMVFWSYVASLGLATKDGDWDALTLQVRYLLYGPRWVDKLRS